VLATGLALWIGYGTLKSDYVIIVANAVGFALVASLIGFKIRDAPLKLLDCGGTHDNLVLLKKYFRDVPGIASTSGGRSCPHDLEHDDVVMDLAAAGFGLAFGGRR
jgi:hypothetical protein